MMIVFSSYDGESEYLESAKWVIRKKKSDDFVL